MKSAQGDSLGMVTLKQGFVGKIATAVIHCTRDGITSMQCAVAGTVTITWKDGATKTPVAFVLGQENSIERDTIESILVLSGTFNFGSD